MGYQDMIIKNDKPGVMVKCEKCDKNLIKRLDNGCYHFIFGKSPQDSALKEPPVELLIHGTLRMKCLNRLCGHDNLLTFLPSFDNLTNPTK